jgi:hypothetical protein
MSILFETPKLIQYISSIYLLPNNVEKIFENPNRSNCYKRINTYCLGSIKIYVLKF